jgi:hypothetical protein
LTEAQSFGNFKNPLGGGDDKKESSGDISAIQEKLLVDLSDALGDVLDAQSIIAEAQGNAELAKKLSNTSDKLKGGDVSKDSIQGALTTSKDTLKAQQETMNQSENVSAESKALYAKALVPYIKAVAKTSKLSGPIKDFTKEAQNSIKNIKNPMQIRKLKKTLDTGLFVGKNAPALIGNLAKSSKDLLTFAKKNDLDTSGADEISLD